MFSNMSAIGVFRTCTRGAAPRQDIDNLVNRSKDVCKYRRARRIVLVECEPGRRVLLALNSEHFGVARR
jgi:hypothetical protein